MKIAAGPMKNRGVITFNGQIFRETKARALTLSNGQTRAYVYLEESAKKEQEFRKKEELLNVRF